MEIKGLAKAIKDIESLRNIVDGKIDNIDWDVSTADEKDERLNQAWDCLDDAINNLKEIKEI